mmetsp:Transcript_16368/g.44848  ORF Transcript_16368/g.44848 Transcript_16368/m.44848 type:complete len:271 (-) Transcript_16368:1355-2167(-)
MPYLINTFNLENANFSRTIASPLARAPSLCVQTPCPAHILGLLLPAQKKGSAAARPARWPPPHGWECHLTGIAAAGAVAAAAPDGYATMLPATWPAAKHVVLHLRAAAHAPPHPSTPAHAALGCTMLGTAAARQTRCWRRCSLPLLCLTVLCLAGVMWCHWTQVAGRMAVMMMVMVMLVMMMSGCFLCQPPVVIRMKGMGNRRLAGDSRLAHPLYWRRNVVTVLRSCGLLTCLVKGWQWRSPLRLVQLLRETPRCRHCCCCCCCYCCCCG